MNWIDRTILKLEEKIYILEQEEKQLNKKPSEFWKFVNDFYEQGQT